MSEETATPVDLVYAGQRALQNGKAGDMYFLLDASQKLGEKFIYQASKNGHIIGGIYTGAKIDFEVPTRTCYGLSLIRLIGNYAEHDAVAVQGWRALNREFDMQKQAERTAKKYRDPVAENLLAIRRTIRELHARGAHNEAAAFRDLVVAEIFRPLTKAEQEEK